MATCDFQARTTPLLRVIVKRDDGKPRDISAATKKDLVWVNAKGTEERVAMSFTTDGKDGSLDYRFTVAQTTVPSNQNSLTLAAVIDLIDGDWSGPSREPITIQITEHRLAKR